MANPFAVALRRNATPARPTLDGAVGSGGGVLVPVYQDKIPQWSDWSAHRAIQEGMKASVWVYICVERLMKAAASVPWRAEVKEGDEWVPAEDHPLTDLLEHPNPFMGRQDWIERSVANLYLVGNALTAKLMVRGVVAELWPMWELDKIQPVPSRTNFIVRYDYRRDGEPIPIDPQEVMHLMFQDPGNPFWGLAPLKAAAQVVDTDVEAVRWNKVLLQNRAVGDGVFVSDGPLTQTQWEEARLRVREQYSGADNARAPWVLGNGTKYQPMSINPVEMDWIESRRATRTEIAAVFGVPLPMVGVYDDATLANIETARRIFWEDTVIPLLDDIADGINASITPHFGKRGQLRAKYDTSQVPALRENLEAKVAQYVKLVGAGVPPNMAAQRVGLGIDHIEGGDVALIPATWVPLSMAGEGEPAGARPPVL